MSQIRLLSMGALMSCFVALVSAQGPDPLWTEYYGGASSDYGYSLEKTDDGGYIVCGVLGMTGDGERIYVIKTDSLGDTVWTCVPLHVDGKGYAIELAYDGGYVIGGQRNNEACVIKIDAAGQLQWHRIYDADGNVRVYALEKAGDGCYLFVGSVESQNPGDWDLYIVKFDSVGDVVWTKMYGGSEIDVARSIKQTNDGRYVVAGYSASFTAYDDYDVWFLKIDADGDTIWTQSFGAADDDYAYAVQQTLDGGYVAVGYTSSFGSWLPPNVYAIKTDSMGELVWFKAYGGNESDMAYAVSQTRDGGYIVAGYTEAIGDSIWLLKLDYSGDTLWTRTYGRGVGYGVFQVDNGGYVFTGHSSGGYGGYDIALVKTEYDPFDVMEDGNDAVYKGTLNLLPNPFRTQLNIQCEIATPSRKSISVYNTAGYVVRNIDMIYDKPQHMARAIWDGKDDNDDDLPAGIYFVHIDGCVSSANHKVILVR